MAEGSLSVEDAEAALNPPEYDPKNVPKSVQGVSRLNQDSHIQLSQVIFYQGLVLALI